MKKTVLSLSLLSLLCGSAAFAQSSSVATNPVGFISITVKGATGSAPGLTLVSPTLTNPTAFQSTVASVSGTTITITGASFTTNEFNGSNGSFYVEDVSMSSGGAGVLADITATGSNSVTTAQNISSYVTVGDTIVIRQHVTINQFLSATNAYGFLASNSDPGHADNVLVFDGSSENTYWYYTGDPSNPAGWYDASSGASGGSITIAPFQGVMIRRLGTGNITITSTGTVKTGNTFLPIAAGANVLGTTSAQGLTLATSGLISSGLVGSGSDPSTSDQVLLYDSNGNANTYWYYTGDPNFPAGWYDASSGASGASIPLSAGSGLIIRRIEGGPINWNLPAPTSF